MQIAVEAVDFLAALRRWLRGAPRVEFWRAKTSLGAAAVSDQQQNNFGSWQLEGVFVLKKSAL
ncbi:hypothetical protein ACOTCR_22110 [Achromobacter xylosoxidans]